MEKYRKRHLRLIEQERKKLPIAININKVQNLVDGQQIGRHPDRALGSSGPGPVLVLDPGGEWSFHPLRTDHRIRPPDQFPALVGGPMLAVIESYHFIFRA
jgi:hypothetical protein